MAQGLPRPGPANLYNVDYSLLGTARVEPLIRRDPQRDGGRRADVENSKGECNLGQHEINFRYEDALTLRRPALDLQERGQGDRRPGGDGDQFMAKFDEREGSSCHIHFSLADDDGPLFARDEPVFDRFLAGQLACLRELTLLLAPERQLLQALRRGVVRAHRRRLGRRQPHLRAARRRARRRRCAFENRRRRRRPQPLPRAQRAHRRGSARRRQGARARAGVRRQRLPATDKPRLPTTLREARDLFAASAVAAAAFGDEVVAPLRPRRRRRAGGVRVARSPTGSACADSSGCEPSPKEAVTIGRRPRAVVSLEDGVRPGSLPDRVRGDRRAARAPRSSSGCCRRGRGCRPSGSCARSSGSRARRSARRSSRSPRAAICTPPAGAAGARSSPIRSLRPAAVGGRCSRAWREVCDERLAVEVGVAVLAAERAEPAGARRPRGARRCARRPRSRTSPPTAGSTSAGTSASPRRRGSPRLVHARDRRPGRDDRADLLHRPPPRGARLRPTPSTGACSRGRAPATRAAAAREMAEHLRGTEHVLAGLLPAASAADNAATRSATRT